MGASAAPYIHDNHFQPGTRLFESTSIHKKFKVHWFHVLLSNLKWTLTLCLFVVKHNVIRCRIVFNDANAAIRRSLQSLFYDYIQFNEIIVHTHFLYFGVACKDCATRIKCFLYVNNCWLEGKVLKISKKKIKKQKPTSIAKLAMSTTLKCNMFIFLNY
jgi:hypothetical protein